MESARELRPVAHDPFACRPRRSRVWIEIGHGLDHGTDVACELLLSELSVGIGFLCGTSPRGADPEAAGLRAMARDIHDAVEHWLPRLDLHDQRAGRVGARLCELRWRLEACGEEFAR
jgi:hypothetical protein